MMLRLSSRLWRGVPARTAIAASLSTSSAQTGDNNGGNKKIYEFRTYAIRPDKFGEFMKIMDEHIGLRTAHSKMLGYWVTDLGGINEVNHLWEYDSYQHRTNVRKALAQDKDWIDKCFSKILPMFVSQTNMMLNAFPWYDLKLEPREGFAAYELVVFHLKPGYLDQFAHRVVQGLPDRLAMDYPHPLGLWYTEFGQSSQRVLSLWPHESLDKRSEHREKLFQDESWKETVRDTAKFFNDITVKAMVPASFSPLR